VKATMAQFTFLAGLLFACNGPTEAADAKGVTGAVCNPANASDLDFFRTRPTGITNQNGAGDKYISCSFPTDSQSPNATNYFYLQFSAGDVAGVAQCVAMVGSNYNGISMYSKPAVNIPAGSSAAIFFSDLPNLVSYAPIGVSCRLSPKVELGLIWLDEEAPTQ
jgi:hypothetical protein